jgi:hypothetical protein
MYLVYVAMPHAVTRLGWMVYNRHRSRPTAVALTPSQAKTLAAVLNLACTGAPPRPSRARRA